MKICKVCDRPQEDHAVLNHEFNEDGVLIPKRQGNSPPDDAQIIRASRPDFILRLFLMHSGIIDAQALEQFEAEVRSGLASIPPADSSDPH